MPPQPTQPPPMHTISYPGQQQHYTQQYAQQQYQQNYQRQRQMQGGRGVGMSHGIGVPAPPIPQSPSAAGMNVQGAGGRYGAVGRGAQQAYGYGTNSRASPRSRQAATKAGAYTQGAGVGLVAGGDAASRAAAAARAQANEPMDYEFLDLISEILRLIEEGFSVNSEVVKTKVEALQNKFNRAKGLLEAMDGAEMTPQMQDDVYEIYQKRLNHLNGMMASYSKLPLFSEES
ncbi:hypothetical protein GUITHDRAFT_133721 [Guillardia theta CCMP2712]|uniref:Mediator of RNA polymerase II transcription subunit 9 n=2 Tax=Guillardia theta TaxID=55529 RepID=L1JWV4_GUITC|nr:hypothetical protein GUITHDRAFT_133721 [Guillardia theta CCMP2712]EKX52695.1 hypothetical protein GUITHDRAFT_133721 [Guillardia theta CCMP2712]|eukprot:XP_005839675.1 hypothetical protein GUITHDRAFT_133721 [Guillardia theta CCMP2712]